MHKFLLNITPTTNGTHQDKAAVGSHKVRTHSSFTLRQKCTDRLKKKNLPQTAASLPKSVGLSWSTTQIVDLTCKEGLILLASTNIFKAVLLLYSMLVSIMLPLLIHDLLLSLPCKVSLFPGNLCPVVYKYSEQCSTNCMHVFHSGAPLFGGPLQSKEGPHRIKYFVSENRELDSRVFSLAYILFHFTTYTICSVGYMLLLFCLVIWKQIQGC